MEKFYSLKSTTLPPLLYKLPWANMMGSIIHGQVEKVLPSSASLWAKKLHHIFLYPGMQRIYTTELLITQCSLWIFIPILPASQMELGFSWLMGRRGISCQSLLAIQPLTKLIADDSEDISLFVSTLCYGKCVTSAHCHR